MSTVDLQRRLEGVEVAITGRLASMSRVEAKRHIAGAGGRYTREPGGSTDLLVVGEGGPPLGDDGSLTKALRRARELQAGGRPLRVVSEEELVSRLGLEGPRHELHRMYTTAQLARILGVAASEIRGWVRSGLIRPIAEVRHLCFFDFKQVAGARELVRLTRQGVGAQRIRESLRQLREWLPADELSLAWLETLEQRGAVGVRTESGALAEPTGQLRLPFGAAAALAAADEAALRPVLERVGPVHQSWFERGVRAEEAGDLAEAIQFYERAVETVEPDPEALFNLGNALYSLGEAARAATCFRRAVEVDPAYVEAWNNLGNALADAGDPHESVRAFHRALALAPDYADAHYNLAETLADRGDFDGALHHWRAYLDRDPSSSWAAVVRERLRHVRDD